MKNIIEKKDSIGGTGLRCGKDSIFVGDLGTIALIEGFPMLIINGTHLVELSEILRFELSNFIGAPIEVAMYGDEEDICIEDIGNYATVWSFDTYSQEQADDEAIADVSSLTWGDYAWSDENFSDYVELSDQTDVIVVQRNNGNLVCIMDGEAILPPKGTDLVLGGHYTIEYKNLNDFVMKRV